MNRKQIEPYIVDRDKSALYRFYMEKKISDKELLDAIIEIDNSVKPKKHNFLVLVHNVLFPSTVQH